MTITYRNRHHQQRLESCCVDVEHQRKQLKNKINEAIDELLDDEISQYFDRQDKKQSGLSFMSYIRGIYYLTLARFFNPLAYRMAWQVVNKLNSNEEDEHPQRNPENVSSSSESEQSSQVD